MCLIDGLDRSLCCRIVCAKRLNRVADELRADRGLRAYNARARADAMSKCGDKPRYGSTSCEGNGSMTCAASASDNPSTAERKKRASDVSCSASASVGTIRTTVSRAAAAAAKSAFAALVNPLTDR